MGGFRGGSKFWRQVCRRESGRIDSGSRPYSSTHFKMMGARPAGAKKKPSTATAGTRKPDGARGRGTSLNLFHCCEPIQFVVRQVPPQFAIAPQSCASTNLSKIFLNTAKIAHVHSGKGDTEPLWLAQVPPGQPLAGVVSRRGHHPQGLSIRFKYLFPPAVHH